MKQEKWVNTSTESIEETEQEMTVDARRHSNSSRNLFEKHFWMRMYRNCIYGALTMFETLSVWGTQLSEKKKDIMDVPIYILTARLHICPSSSIGLWKRAKTSVGLNSTINIIPTPHPWRIRHTARNIASRARRREGRAYQTSSQMPISICASYNTSGTGSRAPH